VTSLENTSAELGVSCRIPLVTTPSVIVLPHLINIKKYSQLRVFDRSNTINLLLLPSSNPKFSDLKNYCSTSILTLFVGKVNGKNVTHLDHFLSLIYWA
jgi:hypothetical protein